MTEAKITLLWDRELGQKAAEQHKYVFVSAGQKTKRYKLLSGAEKAWVPGKNKEVVNYIYLPNVRLMGLKEDVTAALKAANIPEAEIKSSLKTAYTKDNHGDEYTAELDRLKTYQSSATTLNKDKLKYGLEDLEWFIEALKDCKEEPIDKNANKTTQVSPKSKRDIFRSMWDKAQESGKIIDVSQLETAGGKLKDQPTKKGLKVKSTTHNLETDNLKNYKKAIEWIYGSTENHEADIETVKGLLAEKKKGTKPAAKAKAKTPVKGKRS